MNIMEQCKLDAEKWFSEIAFILVVEYAKTHGVQFNERFHQADQFDEFHEKTVALKAKELLESRLAQ